MGKTFLLLLFMGTYSWAQSFQYNLEITPEKYRLLINMKFRPSVMLSDVTKGFKNETLQVEISDSIKSVIFAPPMVKEYKQTLEVRSWGVTSYLVSQCIEDFQTLSWTKSCQLLTKEKDGGIYMNLKKDVIRCERKESGVECQADIQGQSKAITVFGITLLTPQKFSLRAKIPALYSFSQIWWSLNHVTLDFEEIKSNFKKSKLKSKIDEMLDQGLKILMTQDSFLFSTEYKEL